MSDRDALGELATMLRELARRLDEVAPLVTEDQARRLCDQLEPSANELGARLASFQF